MGGNCRVNNIRNIRVELIVKDVDFKGGRVSHPGNNDSNRGPDPWELGATDSLIQRAG